MSSARCQVVACAILKNEFERVIGDRDIPLHLLEHGLHLTPKEMPAKIIEKVADIEEREKPETLLLGYGFCSKGILGVGGKRGTMVVPRCHDCLAMLMGSLARYQEIFRKTPGTYYLSSGWVEYEFDPLSSALTRYAQRLGEARALKAMNLELANYTHICFINNGLGDQKKLRERALENCRVFKKDYMEIEADLAYFKNLVDGPRQPDDFIRLAPGEAITEDMYI